MSQQTNVAVRKVKKKIIVVKRKKRPPELVENFPLSDLKEHPKRSVYYSRPSLREVMALADKMERNGQSEPAEITPDGILIVGYACAAAKRLRRQQTIWVLIRHDLAGNEQAIERRLLEGYKSGRHLSTLERALLEHRVSQLSFHEETGRDRGHVTKKIAKTLEITPRQVRNYIKLFKGPPELLQAVLDGAINVSDAFGVQKLSPEESKPILKSIRENSSNGKIQDPLRRTGNPVPSAPKFATVLANLFKLGDQLAGNAACGTLLTDSQRQSLAELIRLLTKILRGSSPGTEK